MKIVGHCDGSETWCWVCAASLRCSWLVSRIGIVTMFIRIGSGIVVHAKWIPVA